MTADDIKRIERSMHELKLTQPDPQTQALANQIVDLVHEIRRLRALVHDAVKRVGQHDSGVASLLAEQIDWKPPGPI